MTALNVPLLRKVLEHITDHPEEHDQEQWAARNRCGTVLCLAGHVAVMTGHQIEWEDYEGDDGSPVEVGHELVDGGGPIGEIARVELGLDQLQARRLFASNNTLRDLWAMAHCWSGGEIERPEVTS